MPRIRAIIPKMATAIWEAVLANEIASAEFHQLMIFLPISIILVDPAAQLYIDMLRGREQALLMVQKAPCFQSIPSVQNGIVTPGPT
jgi:hypothetical protein